MYSACLNKTCKRGSREKTGYEARQTNKHNYRKLINYDEMVYPEMERVC